MIQKTTWKHFLIIGISFILITNCSKETEAPIQRINYVYKNNSGIDLTLEVYNRFDVNFVSHDILNGESVETHTSSHEGPAIFFYDTNVNKIGVYVIIRFSDNKCLRYYNANSENNRIFDIKKYDNYSPELVKQKQFTLNYTITEEEYNQAEDCD